MPDSEFDPKPTTKAKPSASRRPGLIRRTLRRHWPGILAVWILGSLGLGAYAYQNLKPTYRALSMLRVDPQVTDLYQVRSQPENLDAFLQTQVQLITSPNVLTAAGTNPKAAVLERIQKAGDVVQELRKAIAVVVIPGTYLIEVSMTSPNAYECATLVNAVVDAFMEANIEWSDGMTRIQIRNLEAYNVELKNQTDELERQWMALAAKGDLDVMVDPGKVALNPGDPRPAADGNITIEEYRAVYKQLNEIKLELAQAEAWLTTVKAAIDKARNGASPAEERDLIEQQVKRRLQVDPEVTQLAAEMAIARTKLAEASRLAGSLGDPVVRAAKLKHDTLNQKWERLWDVKSQAIREQIELGGGGKALEPARELSEATTLVNKLRVKQVSMRQQFAQLEVRNKTVATDSVKIALIQDERATLREMQAAVLRRLEQLRYEAKGQARIRPVNPSGAMVPGRPISDPRPALAAIPFAMLFVASCLFVVVEASSAAPAAEGQPAA